MINTQDEELLTTEEFARLVKLSCSCLEKDRTKGQKRFKVIKRGKMVRYPKYENLRLMGIAS